MVTNLRQLTSQALYVILTCILASISNGVFALNDLCIPTVGGLVAAPDVSDGVVDGDVGWNRAVKIGLRENMGVPKAGTVQIGRTADSFYLALELETNPAPSADDTMVLAFSTDAVPEHDWRIQIRPFQYVDPADSADYTGLLPLASQYWRNSGKWNTVMPAGSLDPTYWYADKPADFSTIGDVHVRRKGGFWSLEIRIPISNNPIDAGGNAKLYIPASGEFNFYFNVLSTNLLVGTFTQDPWPNSAGVTGTGYLNRNTPAKSSWGTLSFNTRVACAGVYLQATDVGVRQSSTTGAPLGTTSRTSPILPPFTAASGTAITTAAQCASQLADAYRWPADKSIPNYYVAIPRNNGSSPAQRVYAQFYVAPWGIPGTSNQNWNPIGELYDPDPATHVYQTQEEAIPTDVSGTSRPELQTAWQLSYKQACAYALSNYYGMKGHHCIQAELFSNDPSTVILNKSVQINHNFVTASVAEMTPEISVAGAGRNLHCKDAMRKAGQCEHEVILVVDKAVQRYVRDGSFYFSAAKPVMETHSGSPSKAKVGRDVVLSEIRPQFKAFSRIPAEIFPKGLDESQTEIVRGYLRTGNTLIVGDHSYEYAKYLGGYGYTAGHAGTVDGWKDSLTYKDETKLKILGEGVYSLKVPEEGSIKLAARIEAVEPGVCVPTPCQPCPNIKIGSSNGSGLPGALVLFGCIGGLGGLVFRKRRKGDKGPVE